MQTILFKISTLLVLFLSVNSLVTYTEVNDCFLINSDNVGGSVS